MVQVEGTAYKQYFDLVIDVPVAIEGFSFCFRFMKSFRKNLETDLNKRMKNMKFVKCLTEKFFVTQVKRTTT